MIFVARRLKEDKTGILAKNVILTSVLTVASSIRNNCHRRDREGIKKICRILNYKNQIVLSQMNRMNKYLLFIAASSIKCLLKRQHIEV